MFFRKKRKKINFRILGFSMSDETKNGIWTLMLILGAVAFAASFLGQAGEAGRFLDLYSGRIFGIGKWSLPLALSLAAFGLGESERTKFDGANLIGLFLFLTCSSPLLHLISSGSGGVLGSIISGALVGYFGPIVAAALFSFTLLASLLLLLDASLGDLFGRESFLFKLSSLFFSVIFYPFICRSGESDSALMSDGKETAGDKGESGGEAALPERYACGEATNARTAVREYKAADEREEDWPEKGIEDRGHPCSKSRVRINIPLDLLKSRAQKPESGNIGRNQEIIRKTLADFGVPAAMGEVRVGPTVTQYTLKPATGVSVSRIKSLADDLALNLALHPVRIEAPIPGHSLVGLEAPNQTKAIVALKEVLGSNKFKERKSNLMVALGRDVSGHVWLDDLAKMPHLLVAGATGSGKSVCLHAMIISLLYQNDPDDLKMILIDAKQVELSIYEGMPYLVAPVVTDSKRAIRALQWCLGEMDRRLEKLKEAGCQNIGDYNKKGRRMPYLLVVVDELGDLLSTSRKETEGAIIRLGQKARAAGIHLILATQRPSVDILSGLIKANMPARIAFSVTSAVNSKTILDFTGAEKLLGNGDMLYVNSSLPKPIRIQGAYIGKDEIKSIVNYAKKKAGKAEYIEDITEQKTEQSSMDGIEDVDDGLMDQARRLISETGKASASMLQSRLAIGYPRANRILDLFEKQGLVGPSVQNRPRAVYSSRLQE